MYSHREVAICGLVPHHPDGRDVAAGVEVAGGGGGGGGGGGQRRGRGGVAVLSHRRLRGLVAEAIGLERKRTSDRLN